MTALDLLGATVRTCRRRLGLSQEALADRVGLHRTYIGGIERGERNVALLNLLRLARALETQLSKLLPCLDSRPNLFPMPVAFSAKRTMRQVEARLLQVSYSLNIQHKSTRVFGRSVWAAFLLYLCVVIG